MSEMKVTQGETVDVAERHRFDAKKVERYMEEHVEGFRGPLTVGQFAGGQSNPTYRLDAPSGSYVMRRKPPGKLLPSAHAVDREFRVIKALNQTDFPVPRAYVLCEDETVTGTPFYIMSFMPGRVFWDPSMPDVSKSDRSKMFDSMNETLAKLHSYDPVKLGLEDYGRPGNYFARQISRWSKQYVASETETIDSMNKLMEWLPNNIPAGDETTIVHGDYAPHNIMFHPTEPRVMAVLDWEISTLGRPSGDLTYNTHPSRNRAGRTCRASISRRSASRRSMTTSPCIASARDARRWRTSTSTRRTICSAWRPSSRASSAAPATARPTTRTPPPTPPASAPWAPEKSRTKPPPMYKVLRLASVGETTATIEAAMGDAGWEEAKKAGAVG